MKAAPLDVLAVGAAWRWTGEAIRVDAPGGLLRLEEAEGAADMRKRAARMVRRLVGIAVGEAVRDEEAPEDRSEQGFVVTDGHQSYCVTIIEVPDTGARLLMFVSEVPPCDRDLWVVRTQVDRTAVASGQRAAGGVICFTPGTRIMTPDGAVKIEDLHPGDLIQTKDNGAQEIIWTGHRRMTGARLYAMPHLRPVRFRAGAMGFGRPDDDLLVSPQHRMLVRGAAARALFNTDEVLVAAEDLINDSSVMVDYAAREVTYVHVMLERHNILWANGMETESFHPSNTALDMIDPAQRAVLMALLPGVADNPQGYGDYARRNISASEAAILRHELAA
ncbi:MAG: Hint domain-containing protein [Pseudomonadota bacterium]